MTFGYDWLLCDIALLLCIVLLLTLLAFLTTN